MWRRNQRHQYVARDEPQPKRGGRNRTVNDARWLERATDGLVFHGAHGGKLKADKIRKALIRDVLTPLEEKFPSGEDEIGFKDGRLHSFRHYFCSACANSNVSEQVLMQWLGHKSSKMVRRYYHLHDEESQRQMARVDFLGNKKSDASVASEEVCTLSEKGTISPEHNATRYDRQSSSTTVTG